MATPKYQWGLIRKEPDVYQLSYSHNLFPDLRVQVWFVRTGRYEPRLINVKNGKSVVLTPHKATPSLPRAFTLPYAKQKAIQAGLPCACTGTGIAIMHNHRFIDALGLVYPEEAGEERLITQNLLARLGGARTPRRAKVQVPARAQIAG